MLQYLSIFNISNLFSMKHWFFSSIYSMSGLRIILVGWLCLSATVAVTVAAVSDYQQQDITNSVSRIKSYAQNRGYTGANLAIYYSTVRGIIQDKIDVYTGILRELPTDTSLIPSNPGTPTNPTKPLTEGTSTIQCRGNSPVGVGVIKSTSVMGTVRSDVWLYVSNTKWTSTDLGQTCQWTCTPGYTKWTDNICVVNPVAVVVTTSPCWTDTANIVWPVVRICDPTTKKWYTQWQTPTQGSTLTLIDASTSDGNIITRLKQTVTGGGTNLMACTQPDHVDINCKPTINLETTTSDEWQYEGNGRYNVDEDVTGYKYPDITYRSCYLPTGGTTQCFTFTPKNTSNNCKWSYPVVINSGGVGSPNPATTACTTSTNWRNSVNSSNQVVAICSCSAATP